MAPRVEPQYEGVPKTAPANEERADTGLRQRKAINMPSFSDSEDEDFDESKLTERERAKKKWVRRLNWVWRKLTAAFWIGLACATIYYTNFFRVIWEHPGVNRTYFYLAMAALAFNMTLLAYMAVWLATIKGIEAPWETHIPQAVPVMAIVGFTTLFLFFFALWPVWGIMTLGIQIVFFLGFLSAGQFLPSGPVGTLMMFVIFFGAFFTSEMIPHEGLAHYTYKPKP